MGPGGHCFLGLWMVGCCWLLVGAMQCLASGASLGYGCFTGGGGFSSSLRFAVRGTVGQPVATHGASVGGGLSLEAGWWPHAEPAPNTPPWLAGATNAVIDECVALVRDLAPMDADVPPQPLSVTLVSGPIGLEVDGRWLTWTPTEEQGPSSHEVVVRVTDGRTSVTNAFVVVVREVNAVPVPGADVVERRLGQGIRISVADLLANDIDDDGDLVWLRAVVPRGLGGGHVVLDGGIVIYAPPDPDVPGLEDVVWYEVSDGKGGVAMGTLTVRVTGSPLPPSEPVRIQVRDLLAGRIALRFKALHGSRYRIERAAELGGPWEGVVTVLGDGSGEVEREEVMSSPEGYYRVIEP